MKIDFSSLHDWFWLGDFLVVSCRLDSAITNLLSNSSTWFVRWWVKQQKSLAINQTKINADSFNHKSFNNDLEGDIWFQWWWLVAEKIHMNIKHVQASYIKMKDNTTRTIDLRVVHLMLTFSWLQLTGDVTCFKFLLRYPILFLDLLLMLLHYSIKI